ncbi:DELTA-alicitoxin-Pse2a-like [Dendronephthya gigantea]|uniref:DELTA-alicitoxin-Pse2a-like n=1 Tax=Dendronephthya gigantea TaxID=151771 RepID=UPI001068E476|nr:DELTA-alicitoxin-Pse2a-like [Dendronephthya gigantea]
MAFLREINFGTLFVSVLVLTTTVCSAEFHTLLGKSIYVPREDLLGDIPNGISFFKEIKTEECLRKVNLATTIKDQSFYKNTGEFYKSIATETGLEAKYEGGFSLGASVDATTKSVSGSKREVSGTSLNLATKAFEQQMKPNCLYNTEMHSRLLSDFESLPERISTPWHKSSWRDYQRFLNTHGSHVITAVTFGASIDQYAFAEKSSSYTAREFTVKACASLGRDLKAASASVSACSGVSQEEVNKISNERMTSSITVRGGTAPTRQKLLYDRSNENILKFLDEGHSTPTPIQYTLTPIWQVLGEQQGGKVKAINLQYYFDGFLNFGCDYKPAAKRGPSLQTFNFAKHSIASNPVYECTIAPSGCHHDDDCHYTVGVYCSCYGDSCIRHHDKKTASGNIRQEPALQKESGWAWNGCGWATAGFSCYCEKENSQRKAIWPIV